MDSLSTACGTDREDTNGVSPGRVSLRAGVNAGHSTVTVGFWDGVDIKTFEVSTAAAAQFLADLAASIALLERQSTA